MKVTLMSKTYKFATEFEGVSLIIVDGCDTFKVSREGDQVMMEEVDVEENE